MMSRVLRSRYVGLILSPTSNLFRTNHQCSNFKRTLILPHSLTTPFVLDDETRIISNNFDVYFEKQLKHLKSLTQYEEMGSSLDRMEQAIRHMLPVEYRLLSSLPMYKIIEALRGENTEQSTNQTLRLCWIWELMQVALLMLDDIVDNEDMRRGRPTWNSFPDIQFTAANDSCMINLYAYELLKIWFGNKSNYISLIQAMQKNMFNTSLGQAHTYFKKEDGTVDLNSLNYQQFLLSCKYKASYPGYYPSYELGLIEANCFTQELWNKIKPILFKLSFFCKLQNDFEDLFRDQNVVCNRKIRSGTDISTAQISWFSVHAWEKGNERQRQILSSNYGKDNPESIAAVVDIYEEMKLDELFQQEEEASYQILVNEINNLDSIVPSNIFYDAVYVLYKKRPDLDIQISVTAS